MAAGVQAGQQQALAVGLDLKPLTLQGSFGLIDHGTAMQFAKDTAADLYKAADAMGDRAKRVLRATAQQKLSEADINRILAGGAIDGTPAETIRALRDALRAVHGNTIPIPTRDGGVREYEAGYYAQMVARTKTRQATVQSRHEHLQTLGLDLVSIIGRVSKNFCTAYIGQVFSLSGKSDKYPALDELPSDGPPFHPNCSKSTRPFIEALASDKELANADGPLDPHDNMLGIDPTEAARRYKDQDLYKKVRERYGPIYAPRLKPKAPPAPATAAKMFGPAKAAAKAKPPAQKQPPALDARKSIDRQPGESDMSFAKRWQVRAAELVGHGMTPRAASDHMFKENEMAENAALQKSGATAIANLGAALSVDDPNGKIQAGHLADLSRLPRALSDQLIARGGKFAVHDQPVTHSLPESKGQVPRGWENSGKTWDNVPGAYSTARKLVVAGNREKHGCASLALHETGHMVGDLLGHNDDARLDEIHRKIFPTLARYLQQDGPGGTAGKQELLAEGFAEYLKNGPQAAARIYSQEFSDYIGGIINGAKP